jgi:hypothetical protein
MRNIQMGMTSISLAYIGVYFSAVRLSLSPSLPL